MTPDPIENLIDKGRALLVLAAEAGLDPFPQYSDFLEALDRADFYYHPPDTYTGRGPLDLGDGCYRCGCERAGNGNCPRCRPSKLPGRANY